MARRRSATGRIVREAIYHRLVTGIDDTNRRATAEVYGRKGAVTAFDHEQAQAQPRRSS